MSIKGFGFAVGIMVGLVLVVVLFKMANTNNRIKTEYDERQEKIRGKAYRYAFYTTVICQAIVMTLSVGQIDLPIQDYVLQFASVLAGCTVLGVYCIWNDVYWGLNNDPKKYLIIFVIALALNAFAAIGSIVGGGIMEDGKLGLPMLNIMVIIMMLIVCIELIIKRCIDRTSEAGED